ncbi:hypothetical protein NEIMUCOT_06561 [Neisseria mucosa ATCC 25996]|uniref:DUF2786 domain-containing protein n=1 Tax=Neisseria mucosa (strain ATCC 25996 / DSM 4631 / NCTC 10774 / M26) TaxID=546266 RepID=D3A0X0_NEIM2|nr:DUF2786 domain-containing protein [Neisseria mucosa]EFC87015.1 hypothetical protein NEIMUCOT_06561 [Neisseria mucosa ATCC 25996]
MDKQAVLEKIKKCLALSKSANEHEAAQAMKQAQVLMKKYEVDAVDVVLSEVSERGVGRKMAVKLAEWQWSFANMISEVFGCKCYQLGNAMFFTVWVTAPRSQPMPLMWSIGRFPPPAANF